MAEETTLGFKIIGLKDLRDFQKLLKTTRQTLESFGISDIKIIDFQRLTRELNQFQSTNKTTAKGLSTIWGNVGRGIIKNYGGAFKKVQESIIKLRKLTSGFAKTFESETTKSTRTVAKQFEVMAKTSQAAIDRTRKSIQNLSKALAQAGNAAVVAAKKEAAARQRVLRIMAQKDAAEQRAGRAHAAAIAMDQRLTAKRIAMEQRKTAAILRTAVATERAAARQQRATMQTTVATNELLLSWRSIVRIFSVQLAHRALSAFISAVQEGVTNVIALEKSISELQTISQNTQLTFEEWAQEARELSDAFGIDAVLEIEAAYQALSNQIAEGAETFAFMRQSSRLAIATVSDSATAVNVLTAVINAFGKDAGDTELIAAKLFKTIELGRLRLPDLGKTIGRVAVPSRALNISLDEMLAQLQTITIGGLQSERAMTQMLGIMIKMIKPTGTMKDLFRDIGIESGEQAIAIFGFSGFLEILREKTKGSSTELAKLINRVRGLGGAIRLTNEGFAIFNQNLAETENAGESFNKAIDLIFATSGKKLELELNKIKNFFQFDVARGMLNTLDELTSGFGGLASAVETLTVLFGVGLVAAAAAGTGALIALGLAHPIVAGVAAGVLATGLAIDQIRRRGTERVADQNFRIWKKSFDEVTDAQDLQLAKMFESIEKHLTKVEREFEQQAASQIAENDRIVDEIIENYDDILDGAKIIMSGVKDTMIENLREAERAFDDLLKKARQVFQDIQDAERSRQLQIFDIGLEEKTPKEQAQALDQALFDLRQRSLAEALRGDLESFDKTTTTVMDLFKRRIDLYIEQTDRVEQIPIFKPGKVIGTINGRPFREQPQFTGKFKPGERILDPKRAIFLQGELNSLIQETQERRTFILNITQQEAAISAQSVDIQTRVTDDFEKRFKILQDFDLASLVDIKDVDKLDTIGQGLLDNFGTLRDILADPSAVGFLPSSLDIAQAKTELDQMQNDLNTGFDNQRESIILKLSRVEREEDAKTARLSLQRDRDNLQELQKDERQILTGLALLKEKTAIRPVAGPVGRVGVFAGELLDQGLGIANLKEFSENVITLLEGLEAHTITPEQAAGPVALITGILDAVDKAALTPESLLTFETLELLSTKLANAGPDVATTSASIQELIDRIAATAADQGNAVAVIGNTLDGFSSLNDAIFFVGEQIDITVTRINNAINRLGAGPVVQQFADGGQVFQPRGTDTVPAMLTPGEFVTSRNSVQGNIVTLMKIAGGAKFDQPAYLAGGGPVTHNNSFHVVPTGNAAFDVRTISRQLRVAESRGITTLQEKVTRRISL